VAEDDIPMCISLFWQSKKTVESSLSDVVPLKEKKNIIIIIVRRCLPSIKIFVMSVRAVVPLPLIKAFGKRKKKS
jgi:hypothetical protein